VLKYGISGGYVMKLTAKAVQAAKPKEKQYKLSDGAGLCLLVKPNGSKLWHFNYRFNHKHRTISFGMYPDVSLARARERLQESRELLSEGIDPSAHKKAAQRQHQALSEDIFEAVAREYLEKKSDVRTEKHTRDETGRLERDIFPWIGKRPIAEITAPELLEVLRRIEQRGHIESASRLRSSCGQVFRYAVATGRAERDVSADLRGALKCPKRMHLAALTDPKDVADLLRAIDSLTGTMEVQCSMRMLPLVFVRPGELRTAEWKEIDFENRQWKIPAEKMKMKQPHIVPLADQAIQILEEIYPLTCRSRYVFPSARSAARPISQTAMASALARMGYKNIMTPHGFRAMARTLLDEVLQQRVDFIEHQLAHAVKDPNGRAYNRTTHLEGRRKMMQAWADYLDGLKRGAQVIPFKSRA
jgi:integrase